MNILITGGAGFIGSHVVRLLVNKYPGTSIIEGADNLEPQKLIQSSREFLLQSPPLTDITRINTRYAISTLFEDATDVKDTDTLTSTYFLNKLVSDIIDYTFLNNCIPLPRPKERIMYLEQNYPDIGKLIADYY